MIERPPRSNRTETPFPTRRSSDLPMFATEPSGSRNKRDGFIHNIVDDSYGDTVDTWTWRGQLRIDATPNLQFLISGDGLIGRENGSLGNVLTNSTGKIGRAHV